MQMQLESLEHEHAAVEDVNHQQTQLRLLGTFRSQFLCDDELASYSAFAV